MTKDECVSAKKKILLPLVRKKMKGSTVILIGATLLLCLWAMLRPIDAEGFAGSDWGYHFWGPALWNGWNYGSAPPRTAPVPENTASMH